MPRTACVAGGVPEGLARSFAALLDTCQTAEFAPGLADNFAGTSEPMAYARQLMNRITAALPRSGCVTTKTYAARDLCSRVRPPLTHLRRFDQLSRPPFVITAGFCGSDGTPFVCKGADGSGGGVRYSPVVVRSAAPSGGRSGSIPDTGSRSPAVEGRSRRRVPIVEVCPLPS